ncbi:hypothetical protein E2R51_11010 [Jeotgalibacillus sp. S-D1]|uniref:M14 family zinc carboxypeptidase n=1 Tax=Jeotgalibacillus sp. S-D1 TaxID=2552189 RepID=UPI00105A18C2|nr:M14 family zinc carboxypeptidase [Jeotgalibacillus sp. S-D1]TDL31751.1 hypothetical protein E2R51_11010 [Jeotgalibacillus sp. S-D1]
MIKNTIAATAVSISLLFSIAPQHSLADTITSTERKHSLFNSEKYDYITYDSLKDQLEGFEKESKRVDLDITGQSSTGKDLYTITIGEPKSEQSEKKYKFLRKLMNHNPKKAQAYLKANPDIKAPILIHASIHGTEFVGTDAAIRLIERFGFENDKETKEILKNFTLVINVNANPDGRIDATRFNAEGIDLNRDFITQSQPETQAAVKQIAELNPLVLLDLHGYVKQRGEANHPGLILPGTPPHNPNYEYDLLYKWMNEQAEAMETQLVSEKENYETELYTTMKGTHIPLRDSPSGWDVYPPIYTPAYAMLHGGYGYTLEAPTNDLDGVKWQVDAVTGALKYALDNKQGMMRDQIKIFERGVSGEHPNNEDSFYPESYIIPEDKKDPTAVNQVINHLIKNDIKVERAVSPFTADGERYEKGAYIIDLHQAKAGLANAFLWDGEDITDDIDAMYDISAWNLPELWGFEAIEAYTDVKVKTSEVRKVKEQGKLVGKGPYQIPNASVNAVNLVNKLLNEDVTVKKDNDGHFYAEGKQNKLQQAVKESGLTLITKKAPKHSDQLQALKIAIVKDGGMGKVQSHAGTKLSLERLGFSVTEVHPREVANEGLEDFDTLIYSGTANLVSSNLSEANKEFGLENSEEVNKFNENIRRFVDNNGGFIAVGSGGSQVAKSAGLTEVQVNRASSSSNGIVKVDYLNSPLTSGYKKEDIGFVYGPVWYSNTDNTDVAATFSSKEDFFLAGHWKGSETARDKAVIVKEKDQPVTLIGIEAGFRNHTDYLFRLLSNSIFEINQ